MGKRNGGGIIMAKPIINLGTVRISVELNELLEAYAWDHALSKNSVIVEALRKLLEKVE